MGISILTIDGGGMKGIVSAKVLIRLEEYLKEFSGDQNAYIAEYFDLISGTSTGSILTALLLCPDDTGKKAKFSAQDALDLYVNQGKTIFHRPFLYPINTLFGLFGPKYTNKYFAQTMQQYFGDLTVSQLLKPCLIPSYDLASRKAIIVNSMTGKKDAYRDYKLRDAVLASCSAPTYFPPTCSNLDGACPDCLIDGGVFANNPSICALVEAMKLPEARKLNDTILFSLGNASTTKSYPYKKVKRWGIAQYAVPLIDVLMDSSEEVVDYQLRKLYSIIDAEDNYIRIEAVRTDHIPSMDDVSKEGITRLQKIGDDLVNETDMKIKDTAKRLIKNRHK